MEGLTQHILLATPALRRYRLLWIQLKRINTLIKTWPVLKGNEERPPQGL